MIGWLVEFGPVFFDLAQMTGITADEYRAIAPAVQTDGVHLGTEVIALLPENAEKVAETVLRLQTEAAATRPAISAGARKRRGSGWRIAFAAWRSPPARPSAARCWRRQANSKGSALRPRRDGDAVFRWGGLNGGIAGNRSLTGDPVRERLVGLLVA